MSLADTLKLSIQNINVFFLANSPGNRAHQIIEAIKLKLKYRINKAKLTEFCAKTSEENVPTEKQ